MARRWTTRRALKWIVTICCVGLTLVALLSIWVRPLIGFRYGYVSARHGNVLVTWSAAENEERDNFVVGLELMRVKTRFRLRLPNVGKVGVPMDRIIHFRWFILVPLWMLLIVAGIPTVFLWWRD